MDTVVQVGAWTDDCIISTAFHAFSLQYDVVLVADGVSTASKQHFNAIEVMRGAVAKVLFAADVAAYIRQGLPVLEVALQKTKKEGPRAQQRTLNPQMATASLLAYKADAEQSAPRLEGLSADAAAMLVFAVGFVSVLSFIAGWVLRGILPYKALGLNEAQHYQHLV